jgi:hypothetical protein
VFFNTSCKLSASPHLFTDRDLIGHRFGVEPDALHRHGLLLDDWSFLVQHNLVLFLTEIGTGQCVVPIRLSDRFTFDPQLFTQVKQ